MPPVSPLRDSPTVVRLAPLRPPTGIPPTPTTDAHSAEGATDAVGPQIVAPTGAQRCSSSAQSETSSGLPEMLRTEGEQVAAELFVRQSVGCSDQACAAVAWPDSISGQ